MLEFLRINFIIFLIMCIWSMAYVHLNAGAYEAHSLGPGVIGNYELPDVGVGNQTQVLYKSNTWSLTAELH